MHAYTNYSAVRISSFNGATANSPWMTGHLPGGPDRSSACFNGATANSPWMTRQRHPMRCVGYTLQWGHGEFAVDDSRREKGPDTARTASMGPRRIRRG